tara:strand:+ start:68 stop:415 length:348 start_codon:yes stop_codon:yes gene_type:complete
MTQKWYGQMIQPEVALLMMFQTAKRDPFIQQHKKGFIINAMFLIFMIFSVKFASEEYLPSIIEVIGIFSLAMIAIYSLLYIVNKFNENIIKNKIKGLFGSLLSMVCIIVLLGVFV